MVLSNKSISEEAHLVNCHRPTQQANDVIMSRTECALYFSPSKKVKHGDVQECYYKGIVFVHSAESTGEQKWGKTKQRMQMAD